MADLAFPCPPGTHPSGPGSSQCVPNGGTQVPPERPFYPDPFGGDGPNKVPPKTVTPTPTPAGGGPESCAAQGKVWRTDTKQCEFEDARQKAGQDTCGGPLPNCPPGQDVWCDFTDATFKCARSSWSDDELCDRENKIRAGKGLPPKPCGGGTAAAAAGRGSGFGSGGFGGGGQSDALSALLRGNIEDLLKAPSRFTPEAQQGLYGEITRQRSNANARGEAAVRADAARRGMSRAGSVAAGIRDVHNKSEQAQGQAIVGVQMAKINADHEDKLSALDRAQRFLDSLRDNEYRYVLVGEQRRQYDANLALAYANLGQQRSMLQMQLQSQWDMLRAQQGFWLTVNAT